VGSSTEWINCLLYDRFSATVSMPWLSRQRVGGGFRMMKKLLWLKQDGGVCFFVNRFEYFILKRILFNRKYIFTNNARLGGDVDAIIIDEYAKIKTKVKK